MILDIDFFKKINDTWGHLVGDEVLFSLGKQLAKLTSEQVLPARIGGEEFAIIVDGLSEPELHALAQSILDNARTILINHQRRCRSALAWEPGGRVKRRRRLSAKSTRHCTRPSTTGVGAWSGRNIPTRQVRSAACCGSVADTLTANARCSV